ncbi:MAG: CRISPR-associated endonuclease Cas1 [Nitrospirota bacterium]
MGTLYIDRKDLHIKLDGSALAFYAGGAREGIVPINPLKRVVVVGNVTLETPVLHRLADENVSVVFLSGKRLRFCGMLHGRLHNNGLLRLRQYEKSQSAFSIEIANDIVRRKITKQTELLRDVKDKRPDLGLKLTAAITTLYCVLETLSRAHHDVVTLVGYEGGASASFFSAYVTMFPDSLDFEKRNRRPPEDPVNAMLSLCYTMLHYEMVREIEVIGLDPTIGFYHQFEYGRESLACDLIEPYRPDVDRFVYELFRDRVFTVRDFSEDDERPGCYLKKGSRKRFYPLYEEWAKAMRPLWTEEVRTLARRVNGEEPLSE